MISDLQKFGFSRSGKLWKDAEGKVFLEVTASSETGLYAFVVNGNVYKVGLGRSGGVLGRLATYPVWLNRNPNLKRNNEMLLHPGFHSALDAGVVEVWTFYTDDAASEEKRITNELENDHGNMPWVLQRSSRK